MQNNICTTNTLKLFPSGLSGIFLKSIDYDIQLISLCGQNHFYLCQSKPADHLITVVALRCKINLSEATVVNWRNVK